QCAEPLGAESVERGRKGPAGCLVKRIFIPCRVLVSLGEPQQVLRRALHDQPPLSVVLDQHRNTPPLEVERNLVELAPAGQVDRLGGDDGLVQRTLHAALEPAIGVGIDESPSAVCAAAVDRAHELDDCLSQRAGLVRAQHVHGAKVMDRGKAFDDHLPLGQLHRRAGQRDGHDLIGSSSGVSPTASASGNINDSSTGRWKKMLITRTNSTISTVKRMISMPKRRMPTAKAVAGGFSDRLVARWPSAVRSPVRHKTMVPVPLMTEVPANTALDAPEGFSAPVALSFASFSAGYGSPVRSAWFTNRSRLSMSRASAGTRSPAMSSTTSPGTSPSIGNDTTAPSRRTVAWTATERRRASTAFWARTSWTKSRVMLAVITQSTMRKLATSPVAADRPLATSRIMTSGLRNRARNCSQSGERFTVAASFGP